MESVFFAWLTLTLGLLLGVALPVFALVWVPKTFRRSAARRTRVAVFAVLLLAGVTASQIMLLRPGTDPCALPFALIGFVELFYLLGWLFWERTTGMSTKRRTGYMSLIYVLLMGQVVVGYYIDQLIPEPQIRSRVARAKAEMRNLAANLEVYYIDHKAYPPAVDTDGKFLFHEDSETGISSGYVPWILTTPNAYKADPFHKIRKRSDVYGPYRYATNGSTCWIMASPGPDENNDVRIEDFPDPDKGNCDPKRFLSHFGTGTAVEYDGTNGTTSSGDIVTTGP